MKTKVTQKKLDEHNKKYNTTFKLEDADENGNIGCVNCIDCLDCLYCYDCFRCSDCKDCSECYRCYCCYHCFRCSGCFRCYDCSYHIDNDELTKEEYELKTKQF